MSGTLHGRHLENLSDIIAGRKSSLDLLLADFLSTYGIFTGATSKKAGTLGLVPAPSAGDEKKFLRGDGTWSETPSGKVILDTVRATVNGGMWYEVDDTGKPVPKIYYNGIGYALIASGTEDPQLKVTVKKNGVVDIGSSTTATITHKGVGEVIVTCSDSRVEWTRKDTSGKITITIPYSAKVDDVIFTVRLLAAGDYRAATKEFDLVMQLRNPNLSVTWTSSSFEHTTIIPYYDTLNGWLKGRVTYDKADDGKVSVTSSLSRVKPEYNSATSEIIVPYTENVDTVDITVEIAATSTFQKATKTYTLTMQRAPNVEVSVTDIYTDGDDIIVTIDYDGGGELIVESSHKEVKPTKTLTDTGAIVTVPYYNFGVVTYVDIPIAVAASADGKYTDLDGFSTFAYYYPPPIVKSTFDTLVTEDWAGTSWTPKGTASIVNGKLSLDMNSSLFTGITIGGQDFVIKGIGSFGNNTTGYLFYIEDASYVYLSVSKKDATTFQLATRDKAATFSLSNSAFQFAVTYQHESQVTTFYKYEGGGYVELARVTERSISRKRCDLYLGGFNTGTILINKFIVYDGTILHEKEIQK